MELIRIRGARTHNLKNISVDLPRQKLVVITGLSGSGKSSLAFDTLYAEGQRRYVESLSAYARQFLQLMDKPDVDLIEGLSPAIAIEQKAAGHNPRSTVGTTTEIHDYLRLLYARVGTPHCPTHHQALQAQSISQMVDTVLTWPEETRVAILAPIFYEQHQDLKTVAQSLQSQGFVRIRLNEEMLGLDETLPTLTELTHVEVVIDRLRVRPDSAARLAESFETATHLSHGKAFALNMDTNELLAFSVHFSCPLCDYQVETLEPRLFSFNNPSGACPECSGLGETEFFDPKLVVAVPDLSVASGAIVGWDRRNAFTFNLLQSLANYYGFELEDSFESLDPNIQHAILYGSGSEEIPFIYLTEKGQTTTKNHVFEGVIPNLARRWQETDSNAVKEELNKLRRLQVCPSCSGARLNIAARHVLLGDNDPKAIHEVEHLTLQNSLEWFEQLQLSGAKKEIASRIVEEIQSRLHFLNNVGLSYLSLDRRANTISGGEAQRIRLASQIGSGLTGVMYVLDEPSIGLHQRDNDKLILTLQQLRDLGNSVIVVEHDEDMIRCADFIIDMGPGAGELGGQITAAGTPTEIMANPDSTTGQYLNGALGIAIPQRRPISSEQPYLELLGARGNNLKNVNLRIPSQRLVCITGVSGSGKSTLINHTLAKAVSQRLHRAQSEPAPFDTLNGLEHFDKIITVDQSPIGRTPRSNPATYTGMFTSIRELFAGVPEARIRGYDAGRFSFNVKGGRCEACQGDGVIKVEMHFLPDVYVPCDVCHGSRYNRETLEVQYRGKTISQVLDLTVAQAIEYFSAVPQVNRRLQTLMDVGLSYIRLGQSATTLSGGEAQRIKLALELSKRSTGNTLYILDEPTTGLHFQDIAMLLDVLNQLVDAGNTVVVIEHNLDVIKTADWIVDVGPEGGAMGGTIVATGTPEDIAASAASVTGRYLAPHLSRKE